MKNNRGFLLFDVLMAIAMIAILFVALFPSVSLLLNRQKISKDSVEASLLIQQATEITYNLFLNTVDWSEIPAGTYIVVKDDTSVSPRFTLIADNTGETIQAKYKRMITVQDVHRNESTGIVEATGVQDPKSKKISVTVSWTQGKSEQSETASLLVYKFN